MPFLTYKQTRPWAKAIRQAVLLRKMPPWYAAESSVAFANNPRLSDEDIAVIDRWVKTGSPPGDPREAPAPVRWTYGWNIPRPDLVLSMPRTIRVPARDELDYQFIVLPLALAEDRWVQAVEVRPGVRGVVHHAVVYIREKDSRWLREPASPRVTRSDILAVYAPGQPPMECLPGMAKKIPAGADLVLQMHYTPNGTAASDRTRVGIVWAKEPPAKRIHTLQLATTEIRIPPGERSHRIAVSGTLPNDAELLSMFPHMHLRGKAFEYAIVEPGGRLETLLRVAPYDFSWQLNYVLAAPRLLPKGTRLRATAWYDNSFANPRNPDPAAEVTYGEQSGEEMMVGFFDVAVPAHLDKPAYFVR